MLVMHVALFNELACVAHLQLHALARAQAEISLEQLARVENRAERPAWASWQAQGGGIAA